MTKKRRVGLLYSPCRALSNVLDRMRVDKSSLAAALLDCLLRGKEKTKKWHATRCTRRADVDPNKTHG